MTTNVARLQGHSFSAKTCSALFLLNQKIITRPTCQSSSFQTSSAGAQGKHLQAQLGSVQATPPTLCLCYSEITLAQPSMLSQTSANQLPLPCIVTYGTTWPPYGHVLPARQLGVITMLLSCHAPPTSTYIKKPSSTRGQTKRIKPRKAILSFAQHKQPPSPQGEHFSGCFNIYFQIIFI